MRLRTILGVLMTIFISSRSVNCGVEASQVVCTDDAFCEATLRVGSKCVGGLCSNPFYEGGCLRSILPNWNKTRVCNSQDPPEAESLGYCRQSPMGYTEVRLGAESWASANLVAWVIQIILSEMLDVPTSIEGGYPELNLNLYEPRSSFDFASASVHGTGTSRARSLELVQRVKDCTKVTANPDKP